VLLPVLLLPRHRPNPLLIPVRSRQTVGYTDTLILVRPHHSDIKPENILFEDVGEQSNLVLVDLGLATMCEDGTDIHQMRGTLEYMAPEVIGGGRGPSRRQSCSYDAKADVWSAGCVLFMLLSGELPFRRNWTDLSTQRQWEARVIYLITSADAPINTETGAWAGITPAARHLVSRMLTRDPKVRPSAEDCLEMEWFKGGAPCTSLPADVLEELGKFNTLRGNQSYTSHSLSGIVTSLGSGSAIASISGQHTASSAASVNILEREGGLQPLFTEAYSDDSKRRSAAVTALANLAGKRERQADLLSAGIVRLLCHLATGCPTEDASLVSNLGGLSAAIAAMSLTLCASVCRQAGLLRFNTARAINNLVESQRVRREVAGELPQVLQLVGALTRLAWDSLGIWLLLRERERVRERVCERVRV
jgi:hypothetical protein